MLEFGWVHLVHIVLAKGVQCLKGATKEVSVYFSEVYLLYKRHWKIEYETKAVVKIAKWKYNGELRILDILILLIYIYYQCYILKVFVFKLFYSSLFSSLVGVSISYKSLGHNRVYWLFFLGQQDGPSWEVWQPKFNFQNLHNRRRELTPISCPLTPTCVTLHACVHIK